MRRFGLVVVLAALLLSGRAEAQGITYHPPQGSPALCKLYTPAPTTGTAEEVLYTCTIPANTLNANGKALVFNYVASHVNNGNGKQTRIRLGGIAGAAAITMATSVNPSQISCNGALIRQTATTAFIGAQCAASTSRMGGGIEATGLDFTAPINLVVTGETATAAGDIVAQLFVVVPET